MYATRGTPGLIQSLAEILPKPAREGEVLLRRLYEEIKRLREKSLIKKLNNSCLTLFDRFITIKNF